MLIPSGSRLAGQGSPSLSRRVNANSQRDAADEFAVLKLIKKGEC